jgi:hypothetical protein
VADVALADACLGIHQAAELDQLARGQAHRALQQLLDVGEHLGPGAHHDLHLFAAVAGRGDHFPFAIQP